MVGKKENPVRYKPVTLTSVPGKVIKQNLLHNVFKHIWDENAMRSSQHGIIKGKSGLTTFYREVTSLMGKGRSVDVTYFDVITISYDIVIGKMIKYRLGKCTGR